MSNGLCWTIISILALLVPFLFGKASGEKKAQARSSQAVADARSTAAQAQAQTEKVQTEKKIISDVTPLVLDTGKVQAEAEAEYRQTVQRISTARKASDMDTMYSIASELAQKALSMGAREKK